MANFSIRTTEVEAVVQELADATGRLARSLESLQLAEQRFREANSGRAVEAFTVAQQSWTQGHSEMTQALLLAKQRLQEILNLYLSADNSSAAFFAGR